MKEIKFDRCFPIFFVCFLIIGCVTKTKFDNADLRWMNVYNAGDTLIFQSAKNELDTSIVIKKEFLYPKYNPIELHGRFLPLSGIIWYKNRRLVNHSEGDRLVEITKETDKKTSLDINYLNSSVLILDSKSERLNKIKKGKIYEFETSYGTGQPNPPKRIFWDDDFGIVKYITQDDVVWVRINFKNESQKMQNGK